MNKFILAIGHFVSAYPIVSSPNPAAQAALIQHRSRQAKKN